MIAAIHAKTGQSMSVVERLADGSVLGVLVKGGKAQRYILRSVWVQQEESPEVRRKRLLKVATDRRTRLAADKERARNTWAQASMRLDAAARALAVIQATYDGAKKEQYRLMYGGDV